MLWVTFGLLAIAAFFTTTRIIGKKETQSAKFVGAAGLGFLISAIVYGIFFRDYFPEQDKEIIIDVLSNYYL